MKTLYKKSFPVLLAAAILPIVAYVPQVEAQTLFDMLFNGQARRDWRKPVEKRIIVKKPRVKTARYFTYRPESLSRTNFSKLATIYASSGFYGPQLEGADISAALFAESAVLLKDFNPKSRKDIAKAVMDHYRQNPQFLWIEDMKPNAAAIELLGLFGSAGDYGLDAAEYQVNLPVVSEQEENRETLLSSLIDFEILMSLRAVRYGLDANGGRINPNKLSGYHDFPRKKLSASKVMADIFQTTLEPAVDEVAGMEVTGSIQTTPVNAVAAINDTQTIQSSEIPDDLAALERQNSADYLRSLHPSHPTFDALKDQLAVLKQTVDEEITIPPETFVRPGKTHEEMPNIIKAIEKRGSIELLEHYAAVFALYDGSDIYSKDLVDLVKDFQKENKLKPDGIIGRRSISKMSATPIATKVDRVVLAMERLRWHPRKFGNRHVFINQPAYRASYYSAGKEELSMRVIVGKRSNQTNFFHDKIEKVVYNPYWGVPRSILVNEMLPKLRNNPGYLDQHGYEVTTVSGLQISSSSVNWYGVGANFGYNVRQMPGPQNALGELKILFPNKHNIYMHDTPSKGLFDRAVRALSHGCIRLQRPRQMAAAVLGTNMSTIKSRLNAGHNTQKLGFQVPVYVAYFTAWAGSDGEVQYYDDMYGRDKHLLKALKQTAETRAETKS